MSRSAPLMAGWAASCRGITPSQPPKRMWRSRRLSQRTAMPSSTAWFSMASRMAARGLVVGKEGADALRQVTSSAHGDTPSYPF